jgi:uncharacterized DUF497 family protein
MKLEFEWDRAKARNNFSKHGIRFDLAAKVFEDPFAIEFLDDRRHHAEARFVIFGMADGQLLYVAYTERESRIRIISARRATKYEQKQYFQENS